jgi:hypothetical protein
MTQVNLDGSATPQVEVTAVGTPLTTGFARSTVLLLAWDSIAQRWSAVFDAAKQVSYRVTLRHDGSGPGLLDRSENGPRVTLVHDQPNRGADLVYWLNSVQGDSSVLIVGVVHYENKVANLVWSFRAAEDGGPLTRTAGVAITGRANQQQIMVTVPWHTQADRGRTAVRSYSFVIAPAPQNAFDSYTVVSDDRPLVGVGLTAVPRSTQGKVAYLPAGSQAQGALQIGDLIDGIDHVSPTTHSHLGPAVIDEVALHHPGDTIALDIERRGQRRVVAVRIGQWNFPLRRTGYRGVASGALGVYLQEQGTSVVVNATVPGGAADTAGIVGDSTLTTIGGIPVHKIADVLSALPHVVPGETATVGYDTPSGTPTTTRVIFGASSATTPPPLFTM